MELRFKPRHSGARSRLSAFISQLLHTGGQIIGSRSLTSYDVTWLRHHPAGLGGYLPWLPHLGMDFTPHGLTSQQGIRYDRKVLCHTEGPMLRMHPQREERLRDTPTPNQTGHAWLWVPCWAQWMPCSVTACAWDQGTFKYLLPWNWKRRRSFLFFFLL